jgi:hypothetical protein
MLGIEENDTHFDTDIILNINSVLMSLNQLGVGPETCFVITSKEQTWANFLGDRKDLEAVKSYIYLKVRLIFDPPSTGFLLDAMQRQINEFEWRLNIQAEPDIVEGGTDSAG